PVRLRQGPARRARADRVVSQLDRAVSAETHAGESCVGDRDRIASRPDPRLRKDQERQRGTGESDGGGEAGGDVAGFGSGAEVKLEEITIHQFRSLKDLALTGLESRQSGR